MTSIDHMIILVFAGLFPAYSFFCYRRIKPDLVANKPGTRVSDYRETITWLWVLAIAAVGTWKLQDRSLLDLGLGFPSAWPAWAGLVLVAILTALLFLQLQKLADDKVQRQSLAGQLSKGPVSEFLPRTKKDLGWFVLLSITAGICEEVLYRGFLIWYFQQIGNTALAVVLSSILFGMAHSYQGLQGSIRTGVIGLVLALCYVLSGSLWVVIFIHIAGDIYSGMLGRLAFGEQDTTDAR